MELSIICPINSLGYGIASLHIVDELIKLGHKVNLFPIGQPNCHPRHAQNIQKALQNADHFDVHAPCIRLWHQHDMSMFTGHSLHIGFPIFELDTFTEKEKHHLASCDELFVCSKWALNVCAVNLFEKDPKKPIKVVPLGVDTEIFKPVLSRRKPTVFLNVGKWEIRKGHDFLVNAFNIAFTENDDVELWMMCENPFLTDEQASWWHHKYKGSNLGHKIRIIPRVDTDEQVAEIMQQADCGVFPSRAEGWNLEALEMLSCGKTVIATDYSAHTEFLTKENALLLPINNIEPAYDGIWFHNQGNWGKIDDHTISELARYMKMIHEAKQSGTLDLNQSGINTAKDFSWQNTAETIIGYLS